MSKKYTMTARQLRNLLNEICDTGKADHLVVFEVEEKLHPVAYAELATGKEDGVGCVFLSTIQPNQKGRTE